MRETDAVLSSGTHICHTYKPCTLLKVHLQTLHAPQFDASSNTKRCVVNTEELWAEEPPEQDAEGKMMPNTG